MAKKQKAPILLVMSAASACGKTMLCNYLQSEHGFRRMKTCTTRNRRPQETDDDYYFMDVPEFQKQMFANRFVEHELVFGNFYGLLRSEVDKDKKDAVVILDVKGKKNFCKLYPHASTVFLLPPSKKDLIKRLEERGSDKSEIELRVKESEREIRQAKHYHHQIASGTIEETKQAIDELVKLLRNKENDV